MKKGAINKKSLFVRRNIVYQFFSSLDPVTEFKFFLEELLRPVNLSLEVTEVQDINKRLSQVSFNNYLTFINSLESVLKQLGMLLVRNLPQLATILVHGILRLAGLFIKSVKEANKDGDVEMSDGEQSESDNDSETEDAPKLHNKANKQAKDCFRKGLGLIKNIFRKFSTQKEFIITFSQMIYDEIIIDQLPNLKTNYISDKSQLMEIMCVNWADHLFTLDNFIKYPKVVPAVMEMLSHKSIHIDVTTLHMGLLKKLILETIDTEDMGRRQLKQQVMPTMQEIDENYSSGEDQEMTNEQIEKELKEQRKKMCMHILETNVEQISSNIHTYWTNHMKEI